MPDRVRGRYTQQRPPVRNGHQSPHYQR